ncbi:MAG: FliI/YscN family ATPase [bacterium]
MTMDLNMLTNHLNEFNPIRTYGQVTNVVGLIIEGLSPGALVGARCDIYPSSGKKKIRAEVIGFKENRILMMPLENAIGITPGSTIALRNYQDTIGVGNHLLGRVIDGLGRPIDNKGPIKYEKRYSIYKSPLNPLNRKRITSPLDVGIKAINGLLTLGKGQKAGIFAGSGVGKSILLGMITRNTHADINVIALIGERGREVREFIEKELSEEALKKSVIVAVTSDHSPLLKLRGAFIATSIAEFFRDQGKDVLFMMDSLSRFAMAQREIGLAAGEPPTSKGYTPSIFNMLARLLERTGTSENSGSITGLYTILVEGDDLTEPVADTTRSILDGHIVLSRELADKNLYPAIDILSSVSRVMNDIIDDEHKIVARKIKQSIAMYRKIEDMLNIGVYQKGTDPHIDTTIELFDKINEFMYQDIAEKTTLKESIDQMKHIISIVQSV